MLIWLKNRKRMAVIVSVLLVLGGAGFYMSRGDAGDKAETVITESAVERGDLTLSWKSDGSAEREEAYLDFSVGGVLKSVFIKQGDTVATGQKLAEIDSENYEKALKAAEINYKKAKASYESAVQSKKLSQISERQSLNAAKVALDKAAAEYLPMAQLTDAYSAQEIELSRISYETSKTSYENQLARFDLMRQNDSDVQTQKANLESSEIALKQAQEDLSDTVLTAAANGRVVAINKVAGDYVRSSTDASSSDEGHLLTLAPNETVNVVVDVQEIDYSKLTVGQTANVTFEASEGKTYSGTVTSVEAVPTIDNNGIVTYSATLQLNSEASEIQTGMSGTVEFIQKQVKDVLIIPNKAVYIQDKKQMVKVKTADGATEERVIKTGFTDGTNAEVITGLEMGETVLIETVNTGATK